MQTMLRFINWSGLNWRRSAQSRHVFVKKSGVGAVSSAGSRPIEHSGERNGDAV